MLDYPLQSVTMMQLNTFLSCARLLNFTKAAKELRVTPGMVSKKIAALEAALGFSLFAREKNRVRLTAEGEKFFTALKPLAEDFLYQVEEIRKRQVGQDRLTIGLSDRVNLERYFIPLISSFSSVEDISFRIRTKENFDLIDDLIAGRTDVAFAPRFIERGIRENGELDHFLALPSPLYVGMADTHPLAAGDVLRVEELRGLPILLFQSAGGYYEETVRELCRSRGFEPLLRTVEDEGPFNVFSALLQNRESVFITDKYYNAFHTRAIEFRELEGTESGLIMIWRREPRELTRRFVQYARAFYRECQ